MPRIRTIKPEFWTDEKVAHLTFFERLLFIALWNFADDEGRGRMIAKEINGFAFPLDDVTDKQVQDGLMRLAELSLIKIYKPEGIPCFYIPSWKRHQIINRPSRSKIPAPVEEPVNTHGMLSECSVNAHTMEHGAWSMEKEKEKEGGAATRARAHEGLPPAAPPADFYDCVRQRHPALNATNAEIDAGLEYLRSKDHEALHSEDSKRLVGLMGRVIREDVRNNGHMPNAPPEPSDSAKKAFLAQMERGKKR